MKDKKKAYNIKNYSNPEQLKKKYSEVELKSSLNSNKLQTRTGEAGEYGGHNSAQVVFHVLADLLATRLIKQADNTNCVLPACYLRQQKKMCECLLACSRIETQKTSVL